eukprot:2019804-Pyramimonas_sp.AAC.1
MTVCHYSPRCDATPAGRRRRTDGAGRSGSQRIKPGGPRVRGPGPRASRRVFDSPGGPRSAPRSCEKATVEAG